jgi:hypothetical protein
MTHAPGLQGLSGTICGQHPADHSGYSGGLCKPERHHQAISAVDYGFDRTAGLFQTLMHNG